MGVHVVSSPLQNLWLSLALVSEELSVGHIFLDLGSTESSLGGCLVSLGWYSGLCAIPSCESLTFRAEEALEKLSAISSVVSGQGDYNKLETTKFQLSHHLSQPLPSHFKEQKTLGCLLVLS